MIESEVLEKIKHDIERKVINRKELGLTKEQSRVLCHKIDFLVELIMVAECGYEEIYK